MTLSIYIRKPNGRFTIVLDGILPHSVSGRYLDTQTLLELRVSWDRDETVIVPLSQHNTKVRMTYP